METFTKLKKLITNPHYQDQRKESLADLNDDMIDQPIIKIINSFNNLPHCFTIQCCYGHFLYNNQKDLYNFEPLPMTNRIETVDYKIAYIALCIENSTSGMNLLKALEKITVIDPDNIQFCCADWFWERQKNSYALQVEPDRFKHEDRATLNYKEALKIEETRNKFFIEIADLLKNLIKQ
ncbi:MAG: hypothetical protein KAR45_05125 [Desulfobacteraceae bacterium]|nr:hypothetical protein [Desulfobacteraceae bacterium]